MVKKEKNLEDPIALKRSHLGTTYFILHISPEVKISIEFSKMFHQRRGLLLVSATAAKAKYLLIHFHVCYVSICILDYSCAVAKEILIHGRLYVSQNFLCFYANIFRWETLVSETKVY